MRTDYERKTCDTINGPCKIETVNKLSGKLLSAYDILRIYT